METQLPLLLIFLYEYSHFRNNERLKFVKILFVSLITLSVIYCRYVIDKGIVEVTTNMKFLSS